MAGTKDAFPGVVTHRLDVLRQEAETVLEFQGLLDVAAVEALRTAFERARSRGQPARILLRQGTAIERSCLAALRGLGAEVEAESAYLASWLAQVSR